MGWGGPSILSIYRNFTGHGGLWISSTFTLTLDSYCNVFIWGISFSPVLVLGVWLVARNGWWETWGGRLRAIIYVCAYLYGSILTAVTQRWANVISPSGHAGASGPYADYSLRFHFPGTQVNAYYNDYSRPATDILLLLSVVLIFAPMAMILNAGVGLQHQKGRFSIRTILWWTAFIAISLSYMRFLGQWYSPPTGYSSLSFSSAIGEFVFETIPATATALVAVFLLAKAPRGIRKYAILAVLALLVLDSLCDRLVISTVDYFGFFHRRQSPLAGPHRWMFQTGRIVGAWTALAIAAKMGVSFSGQINKTEPSHARERRWPADLKSMSTPAAPVTRAVRRINTPLQ